AQLQPLVRSLVAGPIARARVGAIMAQLSLPEFEQTLDVLDARLLYASCPSPIVLTTCHFGSRIKNFSHIEKGMRRPHGERETVRTTRHQPQLFRGSPFRVGLFGSP